MYSELRKISMNNWKDHLFLTSKKKTIAPSNELCFHWHDYFTVDIITRGDAIHHTPMSRQTIHKGYMHLVMPSDIHHINSSTEFDMISVRFAPELLPEGLDKLLSSANRYTFLDEEELATAQALAAVIQKSGYDEKIRLNMLESLLLILQSHISEESLPRSSIKKILEFIDTEFRNNPTLEQVAAVGAYTPSYFSHLFKKATGFTYSKYLLGKKLSYACALMNKSDSTLSDIAAASGFPSFTGFARSFKTVMGTTPTEYRKKLREQQKK